jgi:hypothetical protein
MSKKNNKTIGKLTGSRSLWTVKPIAKIIPSGKVYKRNKKIKESENKEQKIQFSSCI